ncbi:anti sigma factor C-terminal domain-containing protein [Clostridium butyricum]|uniref:anti sigma factor C-terminal domain-containing protein n=1 Tax=Clostridium butyricum TaxID=1492 RepID=UPI001CA98430|nr:anti sigma factor C-terminal domain-containing protein [Clostridium butyricum]MBZ0314639.1 anti-sigma factor [Clostridium butyricum]
MSNEIDDVFSNEFEDTLKRTVKKSRKKLNLKIILITFISTLLIIFLGNLGLTFLSGKYIESQFYKDLNIKTMEYQIKHPNEYITHQGYLETGYFKFQSTYNISKTIGSRLLLANITNTLGGLNKSNLPRDSYFISSPFPSLDNDINNRPSSSYGLRHLNFLYPYVNYENTINDFKLLNEIDNSKTLEMALSFDDGYSYDEINTLIDSSLITFYWVDISNEENRAYEIQNKTYENDNSAIGIKSINYNGTTINDVNDRLNKFKDSLQYLRSNWEYGVVDNDFNADNIKIIGVVVVGHPNELKILENNKIIKHAMIGTVVDKF